MPAPNVPTASPVEDLRTCCSAAVTILGALVLLLVLGDAAANCVVDWALEVLCALLACALAPRVMPAGLSSVVAVLLGLLGATAHLGYLGTWYGVLWMAICVPLWVAGLGSGAALLCARREGRPREGAPVPPPEFKHLLPEAAEPAPEPRQPQRRSMVACGCFRQAGRLEAASPAPTMEFHGAVLEDQPPPPEEPRTPPGGAVTARERAARSLSCCDGPLCAASREQARCLSCLEELPCRCLRYSLCGVFLTAVALLIFFLALTESPCGAESHFPGELLLGSTSSLDPSALPMEVGRAVNIEISIPKSALDLTGVWWIRWHQDPSPFYSQMHLEELVSFAGTTSSATANASSPFPAHLRAPTRLAHRWAFSNTLVGRIAMMVASNMNPAEDLDLWFSNASHASIGGGGSASWYLRSIDGDRWLRTRHPGGEGGYRDSELMRVIFEDGSPHPQHWPAFLRHMGGSKPRVFTTSDPCMRVCGVQQLGTCFSCQQECGALPAG